MSDLHLFDAFTPTWSAPANDAPVEVATNLTVGADGRISTLDWLRNSTSAGIAPDRLRLYDAASGQIVAAVTSGMADNGSVGWQRTVLGTPATVYANRTYKIAANWAGTSHHTSWGTAIQGGGNYPITVANPERSYHYGGTVVSGATSDNGAVFGVDVTYTPGSLPPPGTITNSDLDADLATWLSGDSGTNEHHTDTPYDTHLKAVETNALAAGASGFDAIKAAADTIATSVGSGLGAAVAGIGTTLGTVNANVVTLMNRWSASLATSLQALSDDFATFFNTVGGTAGGPTGALSGRSAFPTGLWTMADETDFTFQISWNVPADLYTISLTGIPARINTVDVDGATWRPRVGWWALRNGDLLGARRFLSWESEYVEDGGRRMPGVVIRTQPEIAGHVQAWRLT